MQPCVQNTIEHSFVKWSDIRVSRKNAACGGGGGTELSRIAIRRWHCNEVGSGHCLTSTWNVSRCNEVGSCQIVPEVHGTCVAESKVAGVTGVNLGTCIQNDAMGFNSPFASPVVVSCTLTPVPSVGAFRATMFHYHEALSRRVFSFSIFGYSSGFLRATSETPPCQVSQPFSAFV